MRGVCILVEYRLKNAKENDIFELLCIPVENSDRHEILTISENVYSYSFRALAPKSDHVTFFAKGLLGWIYFKIHK